MADHKRRMKALKEKGRELHAGMVSRIKAAIDKIAADISAELAVKSLKDGINDENLKAISHANATAGSRKNDSESIEILKSEALSVKILQPQSPVEIWPVIIDTPPLRPFDRDAWVYTQSTPQPSIHPNDDMSIVTFNASDNQK